MKKIALLSLIFSCFFGAIHSSYQENIDEIWDQTVAKVDANHVSGIESLGLHEKLQVASEHMLPRESLLLHFYPKRSGFDTLIGKKFLDIRDIEQLAQELGMEVEFSFPQRHLAQFQSFEELKGFVQAQFGRDVVLDQFPLTFPTKIITVKLVKI